MKNKSTQSGFTLVELLVVIAIIGILIGMLLPAVQSVREAARRTDCANKMRQLGLALMNYESSFQEFPPHRHFPGAPGISWQLQVLPFVENQAISDMSEINEPAYAWGLGSTTTNERLGLFNLDLLHCPSYPAELRSSSLNADGVDGERAFNTHYIGNAGPIGINPNTQEPYLTYGALGIQGGLAIEGMLPISAFDSVEDETNMDLPSVQMADIRDGTSNTFMVMEFCWTGLEQGVGSFRSWVRGCTNGDDTTDVKNIKNAMSTVAYNGTSAQNFNNASIGSDHPDGCNITFADGSVRFIRESIDLNGVMLPLASRSGGEPVEN